MSDHWSEHWSARWQRVYYFDPNTGNSAWERPQPKLQAKRARQLDDSTAPADLNAKRSRMTDDGSKPQAHAKAARPSFAVVEMCKQDLVDEALALYCSEAAAITVYSAATLISRLNKRNRSGDVASALSVYRALLSHGVTPDAFVLRGLLSALHAHPDVSNDAYHQLIVGMARGLVSGEWRIRDLDSKLGNTLLNALCKIHRDDHTSIEKDAGHAELEGQDQKGQSASASTSEMLKLALGLFAQLQQRGLADHITYSVLINTHARTGDLDTALALLREGSESKHINWDASAFLQLLVACGRKTALAVGHEVHKIGQAHHMLQHLEYCNALLDMFMHCAAVSEAEAVFADMQRRKTIDIISANTMINGYATLQRRPEAFAVYEQMAKLGLQPNKITFLGLLNACAHGGLVSKANELLRHMQQLGVQPGVKHHTAVVDVLARAGKLQEAEDYLRANETAHDVIAWRTLVVANTRTLRKPSAALRL